MGCLSPKATVCDGFSNVPQRLPVTEEKKTDRLFALLKREQHSHLSITDYAPVILRIAMVNRKHVSTHNLHSPKRP